MENVIATSSNEFRKNFKKYTDYVVDYQDAVIVTRPKNRNVVVISEDEYNSLRETAYLLQNKENREFLRESINQLKEGDVKALTPDDWDNLKKEEWHWHMKLNVEFTANAWNQMSEIIHTDKRMVKQVIKLVDDTIRNPFGGLGKPEPLKMELQGFWSKRVDKKNRVVYRVTSEAIQIVAIKGHYE